jgi:glyoxylase-like metal-dependent hydrolase (beta-lactamase superfamily II)
MFDDKYEFELGGVKFEIYSTPGETPDHLTVWIPQYKAALSATTTTILSRTSTRCAARNRVGRSITSTP